MPKRTPAQRSIRAAASVLVTLVCVFAPSLCRGDDEVPQAVRVLEAQGEFELAWARLQPHVLAADSVSNALHPEMLRAALRLLSRRRDYGTALALLDRHAQQLEPGTVALVGAAFSLARSDPERALRYLQRRGTAPGLDGLHRFLEAETLHRLKRWRDSQSAARAASSAALPTEMKRRLRVIEGHAAFVGGDLQRLRRLAPLLGRDARLDDRTGLLLVELARAALAQGDIRQARTWLLELLEARPTPAESAFVTLERAIARNVWRPNARETLKLARYEMRAGRPDRARRRLLALLDSGARLERSDTGEAWVAVAETYQRQGREERCLHTLYEHRTQIEGTESEPELLRLRARSLRRLGDEEAAIAVYRELAQRFPRHPRADDALYEVGWRYEIRGDFLRAENVFAEVERRFPRSKLADDAALRRGLSAFRDRRHEDALALFEQMRARYHDSNLLPRALYWSMWIEQARGDTTRAAALRRRLLVDHRANYFTILASPARAQDLVSPVVDDTSPPADPELDAARRHDQLYMAAIDTLRSRAAATVPGSFRSASRLWRFCLDHGLTTFARWEVRRLEMRFTRHTGALLELLARSYARGAHARIVSISYALSLRLSQPRFAEAIEIVRYPAPFSITLANETKRHGLSHATILALMRHESAFDARIDSHAGARGLMQLMPAVGLQVARELGRSNTHINDLYDPITNMTLGCQLFSEELARAQGHVSRALAAYNAGSEPAARWWRRLRPEEPRELYLDVAEYVETRSYLERVLGSQEVYRRIYGLQ
ncbi:MAG: transglycosylase SLT domain-containing protein [Candidatus Latescibacterota bacterium]|nr:MAG: transglycosylase SLT domain-containing protein [Candidatus Latescibacterota bacterium]